MDNLQIVEDDFNATNTSFLEYLHEQDMFLSDKLNILCNAIAVYSLTQGRLLRLKFTS